MRCSLAGVAAVALAFVAAGTARADDVDKAEEKLAKARDAYSNAMAGIRDDVLKLLDDKDTAERKRSNPDLAKLKALKTEKEALEKDGEMPKWIDARIRDRVARARKPLLDALAEAKSAYVRAKDDDKAAAIDKEIEQIKKGVAGGATEDALQKGTRWEGTKLFGGTGMRRTAKLEITERTGKNFKGNLTVLNVGENVVQVEGTIEKGKVELRSPAGSGQPKVMTGTLVQDKLELSGRADNGTDQSIKLARTKGK